MEATMNIVYGVTSIYNTVKRRRQKMSNTEQKTGFKYRIGFHQSLTTGVIGFEANVNFDDYDNLDEDTPNPVTHLESMLEDAETVFTARGYRVASQIEPKVQPVKNGQSNKEVKR